MVHIFPVLSDFDSEYHPTTIIHLASPTHSPHLDTKVEMSAKIVSVMATITVTIVVTAESKTEDAHEAAAENGREKNQNILSEIVGQGLILFSLSASFDFSFCFAPIAGTVVEGQIQGMVV